MVRSVCLRHVSRLHMAFKKIDALRYFSRMAASRKRPLIQNIGLFSLALMVAFVFLCVNVYMRSWKEIGIANTAYDQGDYRTAIQHYERAIKHYTPWSTSVRLAVERLWHIGATAEEKKDIKLALAAYRTLRSSLYATQSLYVPYDEWIPKCESKIAELMVVADRQQGHEQKSDKFNAAYYKSQFQRKRGAHIGWSVVVEVGFFGWVIAVIGLIWRIRDQEGIWSPRQGILWGSGAVICFAVWIIGMIFA